MSLSSSLLVALELVLGELAVLLRARRARGGRRAAWLRSATLPSSAMCLTTFTSSLRRSAVSGGKLRRIAWPSLRRVEAEVGLLDRLLDGPDRRLVVRRDEQLAGLGDREAGELLQRRPRCRSSRPGSSRRAPARPGRCGSTANSARACDDGLAASSRRRPRGPGRPSPCSPVLLRSSVGGAGPVGAVDAGRPLGGRPDRRRRRAVTRR